MKKRYIISAIGAAAGAGTAGYLLMDKDKRAKIQDKAKTMVETFKNDDVSTLDEAGIPDQTAKKDLAQLENAKMVSEGSQFGVNYYNEVKADEEQ
ncbi:hypothetical protein ABRT01_17080 [Lentibacillus sp. L22]|uniref:hypothetical protein n=1 Tax=Lentibacillus TaxID=175304 RepID=UPI0022B215F0|nr:hypothetical protein [Lentibacillus daqui]